MTTKKKIKWPDKEEYVAEMRKPYKTLYHLGVIMQKPFKERKGKPLHIRSGGFYLSQFGFRWWNPLSIIIAFFWFTFTLFIECVLGIFTAFLKAIDAIRSLNKQTVSIKKEAQYEED